MAEGKRKLTDEADAQEGRDAKQVRTDK